MTIQASQGADGCNPGRQAQDPVDNFDGWEIKNEGPLGGVTATDNTYSPYVENYNNDGTSSLQDGYDTTAWSMLLNTNNSNDLAQVGYAEGPLNTGGGDGTPGSQRVFFVEYSGVPGVTVVTPNPNENLPTSPDLENQYTYNTLFSPSADGGLGEFTFEISAPGVDSQNVGTVYSSGAPLPPSLYENPGWTPNAGEDLGEVKTLDDQMPGDIANPLVMADSGWVASGQTNWQTMYQPPTVQNGVKVYYTYEGDGSNTDSPTPYGWDQMSSNQINVFDLACPGQMAIQANTGDLLPFQSNGTGITTSDAMAVDTSPALALVSEGGYEVAYQGSNGDLWLYNTSTGTATNTTQGMMSGTSPSIAALDGGGYEVAFQANNGNLYLYSSGGTPTNTGQGMAGGTSPSIAGPPAAAGAYEVAFQANNGNLYLYNYSSGPAEVSGPQGLGADSSPSITPLSSGGFVVAFQAAGSYNLSFYNSSSGTLQSNQGIAPKTSPSVVQLGAGGLGVAFAANVGSEHLYTYISSSTTGSGGATVDSDQWNFYPSSPSIWQTGGTSVRIAFQLGNDNDLSNYYYNGTSGTPGTSVNLSQGMENSGSGASSPALGP